MRYGLLSSRCLRFCLTQSHLTNQTTCHLTPTVTLPALVRWAFHLPSLGRADYRNCGLHRIPSLITCSISHLHQMLKRSMIFSLVFYYTPSPPLITSKFLEGSNTERISIPIPTWTPTQAKC